MSTHLANSKQALSPGRQRLLTLMSQLNFGVIKDVRLVDGEPQFDELMQLIEDIKIDGPRGSRIEVELDDFALKAQHQELFRHLDRIGSGWVDEIIVRNGLPFRLLTTRSVS